MNHPDNDIPCMIEWLMGKKTYIVAVAAGAVVVLNLLGFLNQETANKLLEILGVTGLATIRAAISKT